MCTWHVIHGGGWTFSQHSSSIPLTVWDRRWLEDSERKDHLISQWMNQWMTVEQPRVHLLLQHTTHIIYKTQNTDIAATRLTRPRGQVYVVIWCCKSVYLYKYKKLFKKISWLHSSNGGNMRHCKHLQRSESHSVELIFASFLGKKFWITFGTKLTLRHTAFRISKKMWFVIIAFPSDSF